MAARGRRCGNQESSFDALIFKMAADRPLPDLSDQSAFYDRLSAPMKTFQ